MVTNRLDLGFSDTCISMSDQVGVICFPALSDFLRNLGLSVLGGPDFRASGTEVSSAAKTSVVPTIMAEEATVPAGAVTLVRKLTNTSPVVVVGFEGSASVLGDLATANFFAPVRLSEVAAVLGVQFPGDGLIAADGTVTVVEEVVSALPTGQEQVLASGDQIIVVSDGVESTATIVHVADQLVYASTIDPTTGAIIPIQVPLEGVQLAAAVEPVEVFPWEEEPTDAPSPVRAVAPVSAPSSPQPVQQPVVSDQPVMVPTSPVGEAITNPWGGDAQEPTDAPSPVRAVAPVSAPSSPQPVQQPVVSDQPVMVPTSPVGEAITNPWGGDAQEPADAPSPVRAVAAAPWDDVVASTPSQPAPAAPWDSGSSSEVSDPWGQQSSQQPAPPTPWDTQSVSEPVVPTARLSKHAPGSAPQQVSQQLFETQSPERLPWTPVRTPVDTREVPAASERESLWDQLNAISEPLREEQQKPESFTALPVVPPTSDELGQVLFVYSAKGGVAKSATSRNLAARAASVGKKVFLVDGNRGQGDQRTTLRLAEAELPSMFDAAITGDVTTAFLSPAQVNQARGKLLPPVQFALVMAPPPDLDDIEKVTPQLYRDAIDEARSICDLVVVDMQMVEAAEVRTPGQSAHSLMVPMLRQGCFALGLSEASTESMRNLLHTIDELVTSGVSSAQLLSAVTMLDDGTFDVRAAEKFLSEQTVFVGQIPRLLEVANKIQAGVSTYDHPELTPLYDEVLRRIIDYSPPKSAEKKRRKLFRGRK